MWTYQDLENGQHIQKKMPFEKNNSLNSFSLSDGVSGCDEVETGQVFVKHDLRLLAVQTASFSMDDWFWEHVYNPHKTHKTVDDRVFHWTTDASGKHLEDSGTVYDMCKLIVLSGPANIPEHGRFHVYRSFYSEVPMVWAPVSFARYDLLHVPCPEWCSEAERAINFMIRSINLDT